MKERYWMGTYSERERQKLTNKVFSEGKPDDRFEVTYLWGVTWVNGMSFSGGGKEVEYICEASAIPLLLLQHWPEVEIRFPQVSIVRQPSQKKYSFYVKKGKPKRFSTVLARSVTGIIAWFRLLSGWNHSVVKASQISHTRLFYLLWENSSPPPVHSSLWIDSWDRLGDVPNYCLYWALC